ncbi:hypothetical protein [Pseudoduganella lutea]|uniref:Uncharacterized protein n=1 Tax=Pseudoduganella lutea TaxID=321985 RepID=A0A4P6KUH7_9BURK|nr:hypothetical protein [Pseudoduganella lutea]QBE62477.1 hypothetical protein EWM63_05365 [Pseudoduganella lutea]
MDAVRLAIARREAGDFDGALAILRGIADDLRRNDPALPPLPFIVMFEWSVLMELHPPARDALVALRDEHVQRLLHGDVDSAHQEFDGSPHSRFWDIAWFNDTLKDWRSNHELFVHLEQTAPEVARRYAWRALPAIVAQGDFALGARYMPDPLEELVGLNGAATFRPLFPPGRQAPLLSALLSGYCRDVGLRCAILTGLGREAEALAFRAQALAGITSASLRDMAERELAHPGSMGQLMGEHEARKPPPFD